ncbi:MAG: hypothetical protein ABIZ09_16785 [Rhodoferax sp.]|jgi:hypothetical protein
MNTQIAIVVLLVSTCSMYAVWILMPAVARRFLAQRLQRLPLGQALKARMARVATASSGCDCSGCDKVVNVKREGPKVQPIHFHARPKR